MPGFVFYKPGIPPPPDTMEPAVLYTPPAIKGLSTPEQIALAEHLKAKGAKFYGAYWCSFCFKQRNMFGAGGSRALPYAALQIRCTCNT